MLPLRSANSGRNSGALLLEASLSLLPIMVEGLFVEVVGRGCEGVYSEMCVAKRGRLGGGIGSGREGGGCVGACSVRVGRVA